MYRHVIDMVRNSAQPLWFNAAGPFFAAFSGAICTLQAPTPLSSANRELKHDLGLQFHGIYWISCPKFLCIQSHQKKMKLYIYIDPNHRAKYIPSHPSHLIHHFAQLTSTTCSPPQPPVARYLGRPP